MTKIKQYFIIIIIYYKLILSKFKEARNNFFLTDPPIPCKEDHNCIEFSNSLKNAFCHNGHCVCKTDKEIKNCSSADILHNRNRSAGTIIFPFFPFFLLICIKFI